MKSHCQDCCCARSWKALGITEYTGLSIPEHIERLRDARADLLVLANQYASECAECGGTAEVYDSHDCMKPCPDCADILKVINKARGQS